jgi:hypothetical protein
MATITIKGLSGDNLFIIDKSKPIITQILSHILEKFVSYLHVLTFLMVGSDTTTYSIHDLETLDVDTISMIQRPMINRETFLYYRFVSKELKQYKPKLPIIINFQGNLYETDVFDLNDSDVIFKFKSNRCVVKYILDGTEEELNLYTCKYKACRYKLDSHCENRHETPVMFHVKFYNIGDYISELDAIPWLECMKDLLEFEGYVLYSLNHYKTIEQGCDEELHCWSDSYPFKLYGYNDEDLSPQEYTDILVWSKDQTHWVRKDKIPQFLIKDSSNNIYLVPQKMSQIIEELENNDYDDIEKNEVYRFFFNY